MRTVELYTDEITGDIFYRHTGETEWQTLNRSERDIREFHNAFGVKASAVPRLVDLQTASLRIKLMQEELNEMEEAIENGDIVEIFDALLDQQTILNGTFDVFGLLYLKEKGMREVFASNMSKLDDQGKPVINGENGALDTSKPLGKILKSKNFGEPNLRAILDLANEGFDKNKTNI